MAYLGLFFSALLAATLLPVQSEAVLVALITQQHYSLAGLLLAATAGNTLGAVVNWWLGLFLNRYQHRRWFPVSPEALLKAQHHYAKYGYATLLLSWLPIIGDPLTVVAGVLKTPLRIFLPLVLLAKAGRYLVLAWVTLQVV